MKKTERFEIVTAAICIIILVIAAVLISNTSGSVGLDEKDNELMIHQKNTNQTYNTDLPPDEAIQSCQGKSIGTNCQFSNKNRVLTGVCDDNPGILACAPEREHDPELVSNEGIATNNMTALRGGISANFESCVNHTKSNPECKDCCDCLAGTDGKTRTECRDTCAIHDFSINSNIITVSAPSVLGPHGDYSECVEKGSSSECKSCCEESMGLLCGDYRHCRTACNIR
jgi:hypothetical protein